MWGRGITLLLVAMLLPLPGTAAAENACYANIPVPSAARWPGGDERVREFELEGRRILVLVPPGYDTSPERYPVVYLIQAGASTPDGTYLLSTDLIGFTGRPDVPPAIVVLPDGSPGAFWLDWRNGKLRDETFFTHTLIPWVDREFRTRPDRAFRGIAGISAGGFGALHLAARHPDLFVAAGGLDALADVDETDPYYNGIFMAVAGIRSTCETGGPEPLGMLGDPVGDRIWYANASPASLAPNFGGVSLDLFVRNGIPADERDVVELLTVWHASQSVFVYPTNERLHAALAEAEVPHSYVKGDGVHTFRYFEQQIHEWWESLFTRGFGDEPPSSFAYRAADQTFSVWGWTFVADAGRAPEFLDIDSASCGGLTLTGSGMTTVTTASCFNPGEVVSIAGAVQPSVTATEEGRITFAVDLGPAHASQQFSPAARILAAVGDYWTTIPVAFNA